MPEPEFDEQFQALIKQLEKLQKAHQAKQAQLPTQETTKRSISVGDKFESRDQLKTALTNQKQCCKKTCRVLQSNANYFKSTQRMIKHKPHIHTHHTHVHAHHINKHTYTRTHITHIPHTKGRGQSPSMQIFVDCNKYQQGWVYCESIHRAFLRLCMCIIWASSDVTESSN